MKLKESTKSSVSKADSGGEIKYGDLLCLFLFGSISGVIIEGVFCLMTKGVWESHVVSVWGWFNVLYGFGAVGLYAGAIKLREKSLLARIAVMTGIATALELICGLILRFGLGMRAWDYSGNFMNVGGMICLKFSLCWAGLALLVCVNADKMEHTLIRLRQKNNAVVCFCLSVFLALNFAFTAVTITRWSERHYGYEATSKFAQAIDAAANDEWMKNRFVEWRFLDEV